MQRYNIFRNLQAFPQISLETKDKRHHKQPFNIKPFNQIDNGIDHINQFICTPPAQAPSSPTTFAESS